MVRSHLRKRKLMNSIFNKLKTKLINDDTRSDLVFQLNEIISPNAYIEYNPISPLVLDFGKGIRYEIAAYHENPLFNDCKLFMLNIDSKHELIRIKSFKRLVKRYLKEYSENELEKLWFTMT